MAERQNELNFSPEQLQQHPEVALILSLFSGLILALLVGSFIAWIILIGRMRRRETVLGVEPWTPRVWGLLDLVLIAGLIIVGQGISIKLWSASSGIGLGALRDEGDFPLSAMAAISLSYIGVMLVTVLWLALRYGASLVQVGLVDRKFKSNFWVGLCAALVSLPVVYAIMAIVSTTLSEEYDHPLLDQVGKEGSTTAFLLATFCAVVAAPITEEFIFRVMLQGWLQSIPWSGKNLRWLTGASERERGTELVDEHAIPLAHIVPDSDAGGEAYSDAVNPYALTPMHLTPVERSEPPIAQSHAQDSHFAAATDAAPGMASITPPLWPVFVSGTLFGLAHWGYGLSFIPLIVLGIVLGLLYRAKHSIWPSLVVHFILNLISMLGLGASLLTKSITP